MLEGIDFLCMVLEMNVLNGISYKYYWVEIKYLDAMQSRRWQLFCRRDNAFSQYTLAFFFAIAACRRKLERLFI